MSTANSLPESIQVARLGTGLSFRLPYRTTRPLLAQSTKPFLIGLTLIAIGAVLLVYQLPIGIGLVFPGVILVGMSVCFHYTWGQIEVMGDQLILTEWLGPVPLRRPRPLRYLRKLVVHRLIEGDGAEPPPNGVIEVVCEGAQTLWFAAGYPHEWLVMLGKELAERCNVPHEEAPLDNTPPVKIPPMFMEPLRDSDTFDRKEQPAKSRITVEQTGDGMTVIDVPPDGLFGGGAAGFVFFLVPFLAFILGGAVFQAFPLPWRLIVLPALSVPFLFVYGWHLCKRRTFLVMRDDELSILWSGGPFKSAERRWRREAIKAIRTGPGHISRRGADVRELYIYFGGGEQIGLFCDRDNDELAWLATVLRYELKAPPVAREIVEP